MSKSFTLIMIVVALITALNSAARQPHRNTKRAKNAHTTALRQRLASIAGHKTGAAARTAAAKSSRAAAARTTDATAERLIAESEYDYYWPDSIIYPGLGLVDSFVYQYGGSRSSAFDYNLMQFNPTFYFAGMFSPGITNQNGHGYQAAILFDSMWTYSSLYYYYYVDTFGMSDVQFAAYDSSYNVTEWADLGLDNAAADSSGANATWNINTYNDSNDLVTCYQLYNYFGVWDTFESDNYTYNSYDQLITDSTFDYDAMVVGPSVGQVISYAYNDSGNIDYADVWSDSEGLWQEAQRFYLRYDTANRLTWDSIAEYIYAAWAPQVVDTYTYMPGLDFFITWQSIDYDGYATAQPVLSLWSKHVTAGRPDTMYYTDFDTEDSTYGDGQKIAYIYDSYGEPLLALGYGLQVDSLGFTGVFDTTPSAFDYYYYETYTERRAPGNSATTETVTMYPIPTTGNLNILRTGAAFGAPTTIRVLNMRGQTAITVTLPWYTAVETISLAGLAAGNYTVLVENSGGGIVARQKVVKL